MKIPTAIVVASLILAASHMVVNRYEIVSSGVSTEKLSVFMVDQWTGSITFGAPNWYWQEIDEDDEYREEASISFRKIREGLW